MYQTRMYDFSSASHRMQSTFCLMENISLTEAKWDGTKMSKLAFICLEDDFDQAEKWLGEVSH